MLDVRVCSSEVIWSVNADDILQWQIVVTEVRLKNEEIVMYDTIKFVALRS